MVKISIFAIEMIDPLTLKAEATELRKAAQKLEEAAEILESIGEIQNPNFHSAMDLIERIIRGYGRPMDKNHIFKAMQERGSSLKTLGSLNVYLSRNEKFAPFGSGKWGLTEWVGLLQ